MKRKLIFSFIVVCILAGIGIFIPYTYSKYTYSESASATISIPSSGYCLANGFNNLSDCLLVMDNYATSVDNAKTLIEAKTASYSVIEPEVVYTLKEQSVTGTSITSTTSQVYFYTTAPTLNTTTGVFSASNGTLGWVSDYVSDENNIYYTCMNTTSSCSSSTVYVIYAYTETTSTTSTTWKITQATRYTAQVSDTSSSSPGLYATTDYDDETSYYYRGAVENNYVSFAGFIWRVVRINGDGSIRMIYSGTSTTATGSNTSIGTSQFNSKYADITYTGYVYGEDLEVRDTTTSITYSNMRETTNYYFSDSYSCNSNPCTLDGNLISGKWSEIYEQILATGDYAGETPYKYTCFSTSSTGTCQVVKEVTGTVTTNGEFSPRQAKVVYHGWFSKDYDSIRIDDNDSTIKTKIDTWYEQNLLSATDADGNIYASYLADSVFCSDRSIASNSSWASFYNQTSSTLMGGCYRLVTNKTPSLSCATEEDRLTVASGKLKYPIALITADEVSLAGGTTGNLNYLYYLYTGQTYWTMTPAYFTVNHAYADVWFVYSSGFLGYNYVPFSYGVRPVINLSSNILITGGDGTADNPYTVAYQ